jgi:hypothetical protein
VRKRRFLVQAAHDRDQSRGRADYASTSYGHAAGESAINPAAAFHAAAGHPGCHAAARHGSADHAGSGCAAASNDHGHASRPHGHAVRSTAGSDARYPDASPNAGTR